MVGCSPNEFWYSSPNLFWMYVKSYQDRKKQDWAEWREKVDAESWLQGRYIQFAVASCFPKGPQYPAQPLGVFNVEEDKPMSVEQRIISDTEKAIRERSAKIDKMLKEQNLKPGLYIGEKR